MFALQSSRRCGSVSALVSTLAVSCALSKRRDANPFTFSAETMLLCRVA